MAERYCELPQVFQAVKTHIYKCVNVVFKIHIVTYFCAIL